MSSKGLQPITFRPLGEEIDKKDLLAVIRRFRNLHQIQLRRIQASLSVRQRTFLDLLPLLFHTNHPLLPGFITTETPAGIPDYKPGRAALQAAAQLSKSFDYKKHAFYDHPIHALFLMGSVGSIAYSAKKSDLDIWLCHEPGLDAEPLSELRQKAAAIETWAAILGLEAHIFFINPDEFRSGLGEPISTESCGSIQHHLLLEEFYRTSVHIAGRVPGWWLVPPEQEELYTAYLEHLRHRRFINFQDIVDLGGLEQVSPEEFLGGTLWHLYKAISSPHKSLLKLLLMESYASEFPRPDWLCTRLKASVHAGVLDIHALDSYILMYRKVEDYLQAHGETERLTLARQCFYLKINEVMSQPSAASAEKLERREILRAMLSEWGWGPQQVHELDSRRRWRIRQALEEQQRISHELMTSYQAIDRFAQEHPIAKGPRSQELVLLGRRLRAALERKPGKVEILSNDGYEKLESEDLSVHEVRLADGEWGWASYSGTVKSTDRNKPPPLKAAHSLLEIMAWLVVNHFQPRSGNVNLETAGSCMSVRDFKNHMDSLSAFFCKYQQTREDLSAFDSPSKVLSSAVFINIGHDPDPDHKDGLQLTSNRFDALSFGATRSNLIHTVDCISLTSWHEIRVSRYRNLDGFFTCLCDALSPFPQPPQAQPFECVSFGSVRSRSIALRVQEVYLQLHAVFKASSRARYVIRGGTALFLFEERAGRLNFRPLADESRLLEELGTPRREYGPVVFDHAALESSPLPKIFAQASEGVIQIYALPLAQSTEIYVLDEKGSLFHRTHPRSGPLHLLGVYALYIAAVRHHVPTPVRGIQYFRLDANGRGDFVLSQLVYKPTAAAKRLNLRIIGRQRDDGRVSYTLQCDDREFSTEDDGFGEFAGHWAALRKDGGESRPLYISEIDVPPSVLGAESAEHLQTWHFLNFKREIEEHIGA